MRRALLCLTLLTAACGARRPVASPPIPAGVDPVLAEVGLSAGELFDHHLEQHPDADCRADWRPQSLRVSPIGRSPSRATIETIARRYEGVPYVYGGVGANGLDCSAFVNKVFAAVGYDLPRTSREQFRVGLTVDRRALRSGDLVFFHERPGGGRISHVALYLGNDRFIHAVRGKGKVTFDQLTSSYYRTRFAGGRRMVVMPPGRYSDRFGAAKPDLLFEDAEEVAERFARSHGPCRETSYEPRQLATNG